MSFFSDLFKGNFGNLGEDLFGSPTAIAETLGAVALPFIGAAAAPELLAGAGAVGGDLATAGAGAGLGAASDVTAGADLSFLDPALNPNLGGSALLAGGEASAPGAVAPLVPDNPVPFTNMTLGGGFPSQAGGPGAGVFDFSPSSIEATGGDVIPGAYGDPSAGAGSIVAGSIPSPFDAGATGVPFTDASGGLTPAGTGVSPALSGAAQSTSPGFLSSIGNFLGSPAGRGATALAGIGGLGYNLFQGYESKKALDALNNQENALAGTAASTAAAANKAAGPMITSGNTLMSYLTTNTLPPQFQASIDQQVSATKAAIIQGYTSRGMSGDPKQNSQLTQDLANVDQQALILKGNLESTLSTAGNQMVQTANQLMSTGLNATQLSAEIPIQMAKLNLTINQQMQTAIANFSASLNGGQRTNAGGITLNLGSPVNQQGALTVQ